MNRVMSSTLGVVGLITLLLMASVAQAAIVRGKVVEVKDNGIMIVEQANGKQFEATLWGVNLSESSPVHNLVEHLTAERELVFTWSAHKVVKGEPVSVRVRYPEGGSVQRDLLLSGYATVAEAATGSPLHNKFMKWQEIVQPIRTFMATQVASR